MPLKEWDDAIVECVRWYDVPGMGQFDVDGLEDGDEREAVYADAIAALGFFTAVLLAFAWAVGVVPEGAGEGPSARGDAGEKRVQLTFRYHFRKEVHTTPSRRRRLRLSRRSVLVVRA